MGNNRARGNGSQQGQAKQKQAKSGTRSGSRKSTVNMQAGSGGRGGHRRRKGGPPEG